MPAPPDKIATHVLLTPGTAVLRDDHTAAAIAVEADTGQLQFMGLGSQREAVDTFSTQAVAGTKTFSGTVAFTGATTGVRRAIEINNSATDSLTAAESGKVVISTAGSGTQVFTLPAAATAGLTYTFVCGDAATEIHVAVATGDNIIGKAHGANDAGGLSSTVTTGLLKNTAATNVLGDSCTLVSDGATTWYMVAVAGVWSVT